MKNLVFLLFFPFLLSGQVLITGRSYVRDSLEVSRRDLPVRLNWQDAATLCRELGPGWRLPTRAEISWISGDPTIRGWSCPTTWINDSIRYEEATRYYWTGETCGPDRAWIWCRDVPALWVTGRDEWLWVRPVCDRKR